MCIDGGLEKTPQYINHQFPNNQNIFVGTFQTGSTGHFSILKAGTDFSNGVLILQREAWTTRKLLEIDI